MKDRFRSSRRITRAALAGALALTSISSLCFVAKSWGQARNQAGGAPATKPAASGSGEASAGQADDAARDGLAILEAQLEAKRTLLQIDESRVAQAKRWRDYYQKLVSAGRVIEDRLLAARADLLMMDAHLAAERADLKVAEIRVKYARRRAEKGDHAAIAADQAREELEVLEALLEAKQGLFHAAEARAEEAKRTVDRYEQLFRGGKATEDLLLAARDDVLLMDAIVTWGRADLKVTEMRVKKARRAVANGGQSGQPANARIAELEERLEISEMKADMLQHEIGRLRRELPRESHGAR